MSKNSIPVNELLDWYDFGKQVKLHTYSAFSSKRQNEDFDVASERSFGSSSRCQSSLSNLNSAASETEYALRYRQENDQRAFQPFSYNHDSQRREKCMEDPDGLTSISGNLSRHNLELLNQKALQCYSQFDFRRKFVRPLVIASHKDAILSRISSFPVVVIQGCTGCGKTTQIPQYILDEHFKLKTHCNIIVTQPRRIAAISIARRVAKERNWTLGQLVGYQVGLKAEVSEFTKITFVTTGVLLQRLINCKSLDDYTHIIIDEIHERDQEMDFLLIVIRTLLRSISKNVKIIIMSATLDAHIYADYFSTCIAGRKQSANIYEIKDLSYEVFEFWMDDFKDMGPLPLLDFEEPRLPYESVNIACNLIDSFDKLEAGSKMANEEFPENRGSVLVFLPGIEEINLLYKNLERNATRKKWWLLPLHSTITLEEQTRVFETPGRYQRKIILSTNIAESSITVSDIVYVVDFCLTRQLFCDPEADYSGLHLEWISKASCAQRKGRTGRVASGRVFRMVYKDLYNNCFKDYAIPEMKRCPLSRCVLQAKMLDFGEPQAVLALAIDPPNFSKIEQTIITLLEIGALSPIVTARGVIITDGNLTWIGKTISKLPIDVNLAKLIVLGHAFGFLEDCIIIAAGLSLRNIFSRPFNQPLKAFESKFSWADNSHSDCIAIWNAYKVWQDRKNADSFRGPGGMSEKKWAENNYIQLHRLRELKSLVSELTQRLDLIGIKIPNHETKELPKTEQILFIKLIIAGAFFPRYFVHQPIDENLVSRELNGLDPSRSVVMQGLPLGQAHLYGSAIENLLEEPCKSSLKVHFDRSSSKAYVEFTHSQNKGSNSNKVALPSVYLALKMRSLRMPMEIQLLSQSESRRLLENITQQTQNDRHSLNKRRAWTYSHSLIKQVPLPSAGNSVIEIKMCEVIDCAHFWAVYTHPDALGEEKKLIHMIKNSIEMHDKPMPDSLVPGTICLAPLLHRKEHYGRVRIEFVTNTVVGVFYIDFGRTGNLARQELREIEESCCSNLTRMPMRAFQCKLAKIKPSHSRNLGDNWAKEAKEYFIQQVLKKQLHGIVYSIVHGIIRLELVYKNEKNQTVSVNDNLIKDGWAEYAEEDMLSKQDNARRSSEGQDYNNEDLGNDFDLSQLLGSMNMKDVSNHSRKVMLKGPHSPVELSFGGITRFDRSHGVRIEPDSVNSIVLCLDPQDKHCRLLVASEITITPSQNIIVARSTTLMPNIPGLLALVCMMFAPQVEFRTDRKMTVYTGLICGLGYDEVNHVSIYPNHDMEIDFDVWIDHDDLILANNVRIGINLMLGNDNPEWNFERLVKTQRILQDHLLKFVLKPRQGRISSERHSTEPFRWNKVDAKYLLGLKEFKSSMNVMPLLNGVALRQEGTKNKELKSNVEGLHSTLKSWLLNVSTQCTLCHEEINGRDELKWHLQSDMHIKLEAMLYAEDKSGE